ncbi:hypothetical protein V8G54_001537 [Vigna mungo]|uniref:PB1 domain-containing protein n=1 Tax=Vigna mungo TaxID=3915 RepID=A0AAQ3P7J9_VIGMU
MEETGKQRGKEVNEGTSNTVKERSISPLDLGLFDIWNRFRSFLVILSKKVKKKGEFYGGKIQPRTHDNQLSYVGGDTKILAADRSIKFPVFLSKLAALCDTTPQDLAFKYQLPGEDLDPLISVTNDDDLEHMMHEYDRLYRPNSKPVRMRLFLFTLSLNHNSSFSSDRDRFVDALNSTPIPPQPDSIKTPLIIPSNVDYLFDLDKVVAPLTLPPSFAAVKFHNPAPEPIAPQPKCQVRDGISISDHVAGSDPSANSILIQRQIQQEMQRLQIAENEYRRRSEDGFAGGYAAAGGDYYMQKMSGKVRPANVPHPSGYWQEKQFSDKGFQTIVMTTPGVPPVTRSDTKDSIDRDAVLARVESEKRVALIKAWEESEKTKAENRAYKRHNAVVLWENSKKASAEAHLKRIEEKLDRNKAKCVEKMQNKVAEIHRTAEEKRAMIEAYKGEEFLEIEEKAAKFRTRGYSPRKFLPCFGS